MSKTYPTSLCHMWQTGCWVSADENQFWKFLGSATQGSNPGPSVQQILPLHPLSCHNLMIIVKLTMWLKETNFLGKTFCGWLFQCIVLWKVPFTMLLPCSIFKGGGPPKTSIHHPKDRFNEMIKRRIALASGFTTMPSNYLLHLCHYITIAQKL